MSRILIVEDNPVEAREITFFLREADLDIELAHDAESGFQRLKAEHFDLLLADLHLPGENGFTLCKRVKHDQQIRNTPVVLLTRFADPLNVLRGLEAGADGFISKGQQPAEIIGRLRRVLDRQTRKSDGEEVPSDRVVFLQTEFSLDANRDQLLEVLLSGFEDAVCLNEKYEREVSENTKAQKAIRDLTLLYQSLVETLPLGITRKNMQGRYIFANAEFCQQVHRTPQEVIGLTDFDILSHEEAESQQRNEKAVLDTGNTFDDVVVRENPDGETQYTHVRTVALRNSKAETIGTQGTVWDVTSLKRAEQELCLLNKSLEDRVTQRTLELARQNSELAQKNAELDQYAYVASHDLQEPLRKLVCFSQLLEKDVGDNLNEVARKDLFYIADSARRMQKLVQDLLTFSRAGRAAMNLQRLRLDACVDWALDSLTERIKQTNATIVRDPLPEVIGDQTLLTQLYQNLIGNALKFVRGDEPVVQLTVEANGDSWIFGVRDNGIGIEAEYSKQIFAPFQRLHSRTEYEGTGVGLAICQTAVDRHNGKIWVESKTGQGSHFKFTLPNDAAVHGGCST